MLLAFELSHIADAKHVTKQRSAIGETVRFATLAGDIRPRALELPDEICSDVPPHRSRLPAVVYSYRCAVALTLSTTA